MDLRSVQLLLVALSEVVLDSSSAPVLEFVASMAEQVEQVGQGNWY